MLNSMENFIQEQNLIPPGSHVLCAVSGGADSICLLHALYQLRGKLGFSLSAAHYNHQLRGEESERDARFVEQFVRLCCGGQRLPGGRVLPAVRLYSGSGDVAAQARQDRAGLEETAREMRYAFLRRTAQAAGCDRIATAHTANDNVETILFHLARGSALRGLGGILPQRGEVIRPLLTTTRQEVEDYLSHYSLPHVEDSSNSSDEFTRNRIRHQILPVLEDISPGFLGRMADTAALLRADEACLTVLARELAGHAVPRDGGLAIDAKLLADAPGPIASRAVRLLLGQLWDGDQDCGSAHLAAVLQLCRGDAPSAQVHLPHGSTARRIYQTLLLAPRLGPPPLEPGPLPLSGQTENGPWRVQCQAESYVGQPQGPWEFWLDCGTVSHLALRPRQAGDRLTPPGRLGKTVKKWMIEERISRFQRDTLPVFDCGGRVAAVAGLGPDRACLPQRGQPAWHITITPLSAESPEPCSPRAYQPKKD